MALQNLLGGLNLEDTQQLLLTQFDSDFSRILQKRYFDTEEVRSDIPVRNAEINLLANGSIYVGVAPDGTPESTALWTIVRVYFNNDSLPVRQRIRKNVAWSSRTSGWV